MQKKKLRPESSTLKYGTQILTIQFNQILLSKVSKNSVQKSWSDYQHVQFSSKNVLFLTKTILLRCKSDLFKEGLNYSNILPICTSNDGFFSESMIYF